MNLKIDQLGTEEKLSGRVVRFSLMIRPEDQLVFDLRGRVAFVFEIDTTGSKVEKKALKKLAEDIFLQNYFVRDFFDNEGGLKETVKKIVQHFSNLGVKRVSFAGAVILQDYLYLIRKGVCSLAFYRSGKLLELKGVTSDTSKLQFFSGKVLPGDTLGSVAGDLKKETAFGEYLKRLQKLDPAKNVALFLYFDEKEPSPPTPQKPGEGDRLKRSWGAWLDIWKQNRAKGIYIKPLEKNLRARQSAKVLLSLLAIAFIASAIFTIHRNMAEKRSLLWGDILGESASRLQEAEDLIGLNNKQALDILQAIETKLNSAQKLANKKQLEETIQLRKRIAQLKDKAQNITTVGKEALFYDLGLKEPEAVARQVCFAKENLVVADDDNRLWTIRDGEDRQAQILERNYPGLRQLTCDSASLYLLGTETFAKVSIEGEKVSWEEDILPDRQFSSADAFAVFGSNVYFLHSKAGKIDKYLAGEDGYQDPVAYLEEGESVANSISLAIDGAVYLAYPQEAEKYLQGERVLWQLENTPPGETRFSKIATSKDVDSLFLLNSASGEVYRYNKDGYYQGKIRLENGQKIEDLALSSSAVFLLSGSRIYKTSFGIWSGED